MRTRIDHTKFDLSAANLRQHFSPYSARRGCELSLCMSLMPLKKNRMVAFPWVNFMKSKIRHLPFGSALFSHPGRAQCSATTGNTTTIPTISNCWKKIKKKICEGQILRKLMNMPRASVTPKIEYQDQLQGHPVSLSSFCEMGCT